MSRERRQFRRPGGRHSGSFSPGHRFNPFRLPPLPETPSTGDGAVREEQGEPVESVEREEVEPPVDFPEREAVRFQWCIAVHPEDLEETEETEDTGVEERAAPVDFHLEFSQSICPDQVAQLAEI